MGLNGSDTDSAKADGFCKEYTSEKIKKLTSVIEVSLALTNKIDLDTVLQKIIDSATGLTRAEFGGLLVLSQDGSRYEYFKVSGSFKPDSFPAVTGILSLPYKEGVPLVLDDIRKQPKAVGTPLGYPPMKAFIGVPLSFRNKALGSLFVGNGPERGSFSVEDKNLLIVFASQAAVAIENARLYQRSKQLARLEERRRIAQSLHETVLQYLFTIGLEIEKCLDQADPCLEKLLVMQRLVERTSDNLRSTISALSIHASVEMRGISSILTDLIEEFENSSGVHVSLLLPQDLPEMSPAVSDAIYCIVSEALSNVKKHARASAVVVAISCDERSVSVTIQDDGRGLDMSSTQGLHFGLLTMKQVASNANGEITILSNEDDVGTIVRATFPLFGGRKAAE